MSKEVAKRVEVNSQNIGWIQERIKGSNITGVKLSNVPVIEVGKYQDVLDEGSKLGEFIKGIISIYEREYTLKVSIEHDIKELKGQVKTNDSRVLKAVYDKYEDYEIWVLKKGYEEAGVDVASKLGIEDAKYYPDVIKAREQGVEIESRNYYVGVGREYLFEGIPVVYEKGEVKGVKEFEEMVVKRLKGWLNRGNTRKFLNKLEDKQGTRIKVPEDFSKFPVEVSRDLNISYNEYKLGLYMLTKGKIIRMELESICGLKVEKGKEESIVIRKRPKLTLLGAEVRVITSGGLKKVDVNEPLWCGEEITKRIKRGYVGVESEVDYKEIVIKAGGKSTLDQIVDGGEVKKQSRKEIKVENGIGLITKEINIYEKDYIINNVPIIYEGGKEVSDFSRFSYVIGELEDYEHKSGGEIDLREFVKKLSKRDKESYERGYGSYLSGIYMVAEEKGYLDEKGILKEVEVSIEEEDYKGIFSVGVIKRAKVRYYKVFGNKYTKRGQELECGRVYEAGIQSYLKMSGRKEIGYEEGLKRVKELMEIQGSKPREEKEENRVVEGILLKNVGINYFNLGGEYEEDTQDRYTRGEEEIKLIIGYAKASGKKEVDIRSKEVEEVIKRLKLKGKKYGIL